MPEISDLAIISYLREANKIINNFMNSSLNKKSFLGTYINNLSESIKKFDLDDFEIKSKENYHYKVKRFIQKIALVAKNYSINSNYIQKKYKNMNNNTMNIYYKDGNIRKKYLSVNDYLEQLLKNFRNSFNTFVLNSICGQNLYIPSKKHFIIKVFLGRFSSSITFRYKSDKFF